MGHALGEPGAGLLALSLSGVLGTRSSCPPGPRGAGACVSLFWSLAAPTQGQLLLGLGRLQWSPAWVLPSGALVSGRQAHMTVTPVTFWPAQTKCAPCPARV